jgi:hypothetical protein
MLGVDASFSSRAQQETMAPTTAFVGVCVLALAAPFELSQPLVRLPWQSISNLETVLFVVFIAWASAVVWSGNWPRYDTPLTWPWALLLGVTVIAASAAPVGRLNALHMAGRAAVAFAVYLLTVRGLTTTERLERALTAVLAAGLVAAVLVILEYLQVGPILQWLKAFRPYQAVVGSQLRAGGPLQYPTIASMYLEIVFAAGLGLLLVALDASRQARTTSIFVALAVVAAAIVLTFTRAGLLTMATSLAAVGAGRLWRTGADRGVALIGALAILVAALFFASRSTESVWLRLTSEGQEDWYRFVLTGPTDLEVATGRISSVPVSVTNTGRLTWDSRTDPPVYLSYHWLDASGDRVVAFDGLRTAFDAPVAPGTTVSLDAHVRGLRQPGRYQLAWDVVQEGFLWFSTEAGAPPALVSRAIVSGPIIGDRTVLPTTPLPRRAVRPGRLLLWRAAARMIAAHPLLGVGPDNFRLLYGTYAGLANADPRVHSNDMYIEVIAGCGLLGGLALVWLIWRAARCLAAGLRVAPDRHFTITLGIAAAGIAILLHGVVDSFLSFTPTYVLISLTVGFAVASACGAGIQRHANRV